MICARCESELPPHARKLCSKQCKDESQRRPGSYECLACAKTVSTNRSDALTRKYCSHECYRLHYNSMFFIGSQNGNWRGGRALSYGARWKRIKEQIRARDRFCQSCGKSPEQNGRALDVHHVHPFRFSGDNSPENLVTLCRSCHMRADDHGRAGAAHFIRVPQLKRPTKRQIRRLRQLVREAERRARRRQHQRIALARKNDGASLRQIAGELGVSHEIVSRWRKGQYRVNESTVPYRRHRARTRQRPSGRACYPVRRYRPGSSVGRARV
jgi:5-methylcytosine-specific restriction endonuclease McrA